MFFCTMVQDISTHYQTEEEVKIIIMKNCMHAAHSVTFVEGMHLHYHVLVGYATILMWEAK